MTATKLPKQWAMIPLDEVATFSSGGTPSKANDGYWNGDIPWISAKDLKSFYLRDSIDKITSAATSNGTRLVPEGSILILVRGMTLLKDVPVGVTTCPMAFNQDVRALVVKNEFDARFIAYSLVNRKAELMSLVNVAGHGTGRLASELLQSVPIRVPKNLSEQQKIAAILSTWDRAIELTEKLIAAKQKRKQALMQQLLTGKVRFKEFVKSKNRQKTAIGDMPSDWKTHRLGKIVEKVKRKNPDGEVHVLTASGEHGLVDQREFFNRSVAGADLSGYYLLKRGEFAYNRSAMKGYPFGAIKRLDRYEQGVLSTLYICFGISDDRCDPDYLSQFFEACLLDKQLRGITQVGGRAHGLLNITDGDFYSMTVTLPSVEEQRKISAVLDCQDKESEVVRRKLAILKRQKHGLMQQLLTGKVRVKVENQQ